METTEKFCIRNRILILQNSYWLVMSHKSSSLEDSIFHTNSNPPQISQQILITFVLKKIREFFVSKKRDLLCVSFNKVSVSFSLFIFRSFGCVLHLCRGTLDHDFCAVNKQLYHGDSHPLAPSFNTLFLCPFCLIYCLCIVITGW